MVNPTLPALREPDIASGIPAQWPAPGAWCYADYLRLPDDGKRYEIIEGVIYVANAPGYDHQFAVARLTTYLMLFVMQHDLGIVLNAPFEVHLSEASRPLQPDVLFVRRENQPAAGEQYFAGAPDLVVEVISPGSIQRDRYAKFDAYEKAGVAEYWLVDPKTRAVEVYTLARGEYALLGQFTDAEIIQSNVLSGLAIVTHTLFNR